MVIKASNSPLQDLVEKSGNNFHYKVVSFLREQGWFVSVSPYYADSFTDKPREIDILAEKEFPATDWSGTQKGVIAVQLFIECKYANSDTVFWLDDKDQDKAAKKIMSETGLEDPKKNTSITKHHYYSQEKVAKLFSSKPEKNQENEIIYKAITQSLNALTHFKGKTSIIPSQKKIGGTALRRLYYPLVVCSSFDHFYATEFSHEIKPLEKLEKAFQLEVNYVYPSTGGSVNEYFLIDVLDFSYLGEFLSLIETTDVREVGEKAIHLQDEREYKRKNLRVSY